MKERNFKCVCVCFSMLVYQAVKCNFSSLSYNLTNPTFAFPNDVVIILNFRNTNTVHRFTLLEVFTGTSCIIFVYTYFILL